MKHRNEKFKIGRMGQIALSALYSLVVMLVLTLITAGLSLLLLKDPISSIGVMSIIIIILGAVISGVTLTRIFSDYGMQTAIFSSLLLSLLALIIGLIMGGGGVNLKLPLNVLIYVLCSILTAYLARPRAKRRKFR